MNRVGAAFSCLLFSSAFYGQQPVWQPSPEHIQVPIWPGAAPDPQPPSGPEVEERDTKEWRGTGKGTTGVNNVTRPTMTVYSPKGRNTGAAVVVFPGGGYQTLPSISRELRFAIGWCPEESHACY